MKIKTAVGKLVPMVIGVFAGFGWWYINRSASSAVASPGELVKRWDVMALYLGALFGTAAIILLAIFWRRLRIEIILLSIVNFATAWSFVTLYFIASDPLAYSKLADLGLGGLKWPFLAAGVIWSIVAFLVFGRAVDSALQS